MSIPAEPITLDWVTLGAGAFGLVFTGRIVAIVYWHRADLAELDGLGEPVVTEPGFSWVPTDRPWEHYYLLRAPDPAEDDWGRARELAAHAYFHWTRDSL